ncbi:sigma-70 family RNA polymerase sigma factor [Sorangium sp. So ce429]
MDISSSPAAGSPSSELELRLEQHRRDLTGHCYRMLGSAFDADDAVQETMVRAWRSLDQFEGRAAVRTWLHRIATNVCLDMLEGRARRARPMDLGPVGSAENPVLDTLPEATWILPIPDGRALAAACDPAELVSSRQTIRLAFVAALQRLPPRQRAVLLLKEVLSWEAAEIAELLGMTVASVNSALQRARATLGQEEKTDLHEPMNDAQRSLLARYVEAFERQDTDALVSLLREDATWSMPPYALWLRGRASVRAWLLKVGAGCKGSRLVPTVANGSPALAQYRPSGPGAFEPWAIQVIEMSGGEIVGVCSFLDAQRLFPLFGLPLRPEP